ncbi:hypothetical protein [Mycolicibacter acidiphilus]|uniref:hypothetical protein n=1 Tax=Mycolicibacter acidiphilus TaxID=2835306 RepID=UPI0027DAEBEA|nr:hypothetical protein [Mycolicibacter acidiphilus]
MIKYTVAAAAVVALLAGCGLFGKSDRTNDRFARPGHPQASPSGSYTAAAEYGPDENGVKTWIAIIRDKKSGAEVYHGTEAYSSRHGVGITWLSTKDQLWLLSTDVGDAYVDRGHDGTWTKTQITPATVKDIPPEIAALEK